MKKLILLFTLTLGFVGATMAQTKNTTVSAFIPI